MESLPRIALTVGDPAGIGPEIVRAAIADERVLRVAQVVVVGPASEKPDRLPTGVAWNATEAPNSWTLGRAQASSGAAALAALRAGHELALARRVEALVTAPVSREALHMAGEFVEGQTELLGRWCGVERFEMIAIAGTLRVMLLTRHMPLRAAIELVSRERVLDRLTLFDESLRRFGVAHPRLALAGLNPHAGERGILGREDEDILRPAVADARTRGIDVVGPLSPDTVFLSASRGEFDGVLALYHDQAFIPIKLLSNDGGVTAIAGLPYLRVSPVHGTAFDIAGQGRASAENLIRALLLAAQWSVETPRTHSPRSFAP